MIADSSYASCFFLFYIIHDCISIINHIRTYILFYFYLFEILYFFNKFYKKYCILTKKRYNLYQKQYIVVAI